MLSQSRENRVICVNDKRGTSFVLPEQCWLDNYYRPLQDRFPDFLKRQNEREAALALVAAEKREIELYETYKAFYSYGVYIARKVEG